MKSNNRKVGLNVLTNRFSSLNGKILSGLTIHVTSFPSISYYSIVRLISKIELEQNFQSTILDVHASAKERPPHLSLFQAMQHKQL